MSDLGLKKVLHRLSDSLNQDKLVGEVTHNIRNQLGVDRVVLYYFYRRWQGRVTFEALSSDRYSIFGSTGPDECFNREYAQLYLQGRVRAIADVATEPIAECHRDFLQDLDVKANLAVPILIGETQNQLWGLLIAHHCQSSFDWSPEAIRVMQLGAEKLAQAESIKADVA